MAHPRKTAWKEYRDSLLMAYGFALAFTFFFPTSWVTRLEMSLVSGFVFGTEFFGVGYLVPKARFRSFWATCLVRSLIIVAAMLVGLVVILPIAISLDSRLQGAAPWSPRVLRIFAEVGPAEIPKWCGIGLVMSFSITAFYGINRKLGPGVLLNLLTGKYHTPREEERIFMFLDLRNSTTLAEKLGNLRFSSLCQEFFRDLTDPVTETKGTVSHYIGDEAVLTWLPRKGLDQANCVRCFYLMEAQIAKRAAFYTETFGIVPEFKAGVHVGLVVAAEVGDVKSEIVYHGDVLNTTARITGLCSELQSDLLISGDLAKRLVLPSELAAQSLGEHLLKGKEHAVEIVAIRNQAAEPLIKREEVPARS